MLAVNSIRVNHQKGTWIGCVITHLNGAVYQFSVFIQILVPFFLYQNLEKIGLEIFAPKSETFGEQCAVIEENASAIWDHQVLNYLFQIFIESIFLRVSKYINNSLRSV
jgi:hypothetical protein